MAMRPRGGSTTPRRTAQPGVRPVYETFKPMSEWQQDDDSHILIIYLPGFMREQIKVSTEGHNTVRARGERLVAGNKWSQFLEDYKIPQNGAINSVRAKYQGGILTITVPKTKAKRPQTQPQPVPEKGQETTSPQPQPVPGALQSMDEGGSKTQSTSEDPKSGAEVSQDTKMESDEIKSKEGSAASGEQHDQIKKEEVGGGEKELPGVETAQMEGQKDGAIDKPEKAEKQESYRALVKAKYKNAVKGLAELNEERRLLVNMGVTVLVIVALTAYVTYKFASSKDKN